MADPKGKVKCQESAQLSVSALFSDDQLATFADFAVKLGFEPDQYVRSSPCETQADCPMAGDVEEYPTVTGNYYKSDTKCVFGSPLPPPPPAPDTPLPPPTERRLLSGPTPQAGVCVPI